jgi:hypothetical protein
VARNQADRAPITFWQARHYFSLYYMIGTERKLQCIAVHPKNPDIASITSLRSVKEMKRGTLDDETAIKLARQLPFKTSEFESF